MLELAEFMKQPVIPHDFKGLQCWMRTQRTLERVDTSSDEAVALHFRMPDGVGLAIYLKSDNTYTTTSGQ